MNKIGVVIIMVLIPLLGISQQEFGEADFFTKHAPAYESQSFKDQNDFANDKPIPYRYVREADVIWSKMVWETIDLREKMNLPLYFPTEEIEGRKSLINLLLNGVETGFLTAYDARKGDEFKEPMSFQEVKVVMGERQERRRIQTENGPKDTTINIGIRPQQVKQFRVKEMWFFDKNTSTLDVRIIGLCPVREYIDDVSGELRRIDLFWIYYPEARDLFAKTPVYNPMNDRPNYTYDDLFINRYFNSYVIQEANVYDNRNIVQYLSGREAQIESNRIKEEIFNFEQDLWEY